MKRILLIACAMLLVTGCATQKQWGATGGSRADATVELSMEYNSMFENPHEDPAQGLQLAEQRCKSWGYETAESFGGIKREKVDGSTWRLTRTYQCVGQGSETNVKSSKK